jgi:hypothetical protein
VRCHDGVSPAETVSDGSNVFGSVVLTKIFKDGLADGPGLIPNITKGMSHQTL